MISLTIEADDTVQLLAQLRQIVESGQPRSTLPPLAVATNDPPPAAEPEQTQTAPAKRGRKPKPEAAEAPPAEEKPENGKVDEDAPPIPEFLKRDEKPKGNDAPVTYDQLRAIMTKLGATRGAEAVYQVVNAFKTAAGQKAAKISEIAESDRAAAAKMAEDLLAG